MNIKYFTWNIETRDYPKTQYCSTKICEQKNGDMEDKCRGSNICLIGIPEETENESDYLKIKEKNYPKE